MSQVKAFNTFHKKKTEVSRDITEKMNNFDKLVDVKKRNAASLSVDKR